MVFDDKDDVLLKEQAWFLYWGGRVIYYGAKNFYTGELSAKERSLYCAQPNGAQEKEERF